jgi:hypothetical protein
MKQLLIFVVIIVVASACKHQEKIEPLKKVNWENRKAGAFNPDSLQSGTSYLSVYSQIYSGSQERLVDLTATISMRNPNASDTLYISSIDCPWKRLRLLSNTATTKVEREPMSFLTGVKQLLPTSRFSRR